MGVSTEAQSASVHREPERRGWDGEIISEIGRLGSAVNSDLRRVLDVRHTGGRIGRKNSWECFHEGRKYRPLDVSFLVGQ